MCRSKPIPLHNPAKPAKMHDRGRSQASDFVSAAAESGRVDLNAEVEPVMAGVCDICGKTKSFGHNVSHSKRRTNRDFRPNVQRKRLLIGNKLVRLNVCTRCMRTAQKGGR